MSIQRRLSSLVKRAFPLPLRSEKVLPTGIYTIPYGVESCDLDVKYPAKGGTTYANAGGQSLARMIAEGGMIDAYILPSTRRHKIGLFTPRTHTIHTRIDRIYTQAHASAWRWQQIGSPPTIFTGGAHSDHLPVVARLALVKERPPSEAEAKINPAVFDNPTKKNRKIPPRNPRIR
eukprot:scaffold2191_cov138-Isochrysis_galbana.AAC.1